MHQVKSVGICGSDAHDYLDGRIGKDVIREPLTMGHEFSALVEDLGEDVQELSVVQRIAVDPAIVCVECEFCILCHPEIEP